MKKKLIPVFLGLLSITFVSNPFNVFASNQNFSLSIPLFNSPDYLKEDLFKGAAQNIGVGTTVPSLNLSNTKSLSSGDIISMLKAVVVLAINLFLIVIQTVAGILKALLPFLSK
jgi:hypothetical protein